MAREFSEKRERAERILEAAAELLVLHGYNRVTIDEIAARAQVGKGTVYLHWKTKESLFGTLFLREMLEVERRVLERLRGDPYEVVPHRLYAGALMEAWRRPVAWALVTLDRDVMGKLVQSAMGKALLSRGKEYRDWLFRLWREKGLIDSDMGPGAQMYAFRAIYNGFLRMEARSDKEPLSPEAKVQAFAHVLRRAFEPKVPPSPEVLREVAAKVVQFLEEFCLDLERQIEEQMQC